MTLYHTLLNETRLLQANLVVPLNTDRPPGSQAYHNATLNAEQIQFSVQTLLDLITAFDEIIWESFPGDFLPLDEAITGDDPTTVQADHCICDFCGADVFQAFFECKICNSEDGHETTEGILICPSCYVEGRTCLCGSMEPVQLRSFRSLVASRNRATEVINLYRLGACKALDIECEVFVRLPGLKFLSRYARDSKNSSLHTFEAAIILQRTRQQCMLPAQKKVCF